MKNKDLLAMFIAAVFGGLVAMFAYAQISDNKDKTPQATNWGLGQPPPLPHHLASFEPFNVRDVSFPDLTYAAEKTINAVVHVRVISMQTIRNPWAELFGGGQGRQQVPQEGFGSGVILSPDGYIVTNNHVVTGAEEIDVVLHDGSIHTAKLVGGDPATDLALLKIDATNLPFIVFGDSDALRVGEWVLAVGNPHNFYSSVTAGIVSAKGRRLNIAQSQRTPSPVEIESFIQTDAAINRGNSGGALVNLRGELIGINTLIVSPSGGFSGSAFAIPTTIVEKVVKDLKEFGVVQRAFLGVTFDGGSDNRFARDNQALRIVILSENGGAAEAGIRLDDVVTAFNNVPIRTFAEFQGEITKHRPNDKVKISVIRGNETKHFDVILRNRDGSTHIVRPEVIIEPETVLGATFEDVPQDEKQRLGITSGVRVVNAGTRLGGHGIRNGFIITSVNDRPVNSAGDIRRIVDAVEPRGRILINGVNSRGQVSFFAFPK